MTRWPETHNWKAITSPLFAVTLSAHGQQLTTWGERLQVSPVGGEGQRSVLANRDVDGVSPGTGSKTQDGRKNGEAHGSDGWKEGCRGLSTEENGRVFWGASVQTEPTG